MEEVEAKQISKQDQTGFFFDIYLFLVALFPSLVRPFRNYKKQVFCIIRGIVAACGGRGARITRVALPEIVVQSAAYKIFSFVQFRNWV